MCPLYEVHILQYSEKRESTTPRSYEPSYVTVLGSVERVVARNSFVYRRFTSATMVEMIKKIEQHSCCLER